MKSTLNFVVHINTVVRGYPSFTTNSVLNFLEEKWLKIKLYLLFVCVCMCKCRGENIVNNDDNENNNDEDGTTTTISIHIRWPLCVLANGNFICHFNYSNFHFPIDILRSLFLSRSPFLSFAIVCARNNI